MISCGLIFRESTDTFGMPSAFRMLAPTFPHFNCKLCSTFLLHNIFKMSVLWKKVSLDADTYTYENGHYLNIVNSISIKKRTSFSPQCKENGTKNPQRNWTSDIISMTYDKLLSKSQYSYSPLNNRCSAYKSIKTKFLAHRYSFVPQQFYFPQILPTVLFYLHSTYTAADILFYACSCFQWCCHLL